MTTRKADSKSSALGFNVQSTNPWMTLCCCCLIHSPLSILLITSCHSTNILSTHWSETLGKVQCVQRWIRHCPKPLGSSPSARDGQINRSLQFRVLTHVRVTGGRLNRHVYRQWSTFTEGQECWLGLGLSWLLLGLLWNRQQPYKDWHEIKAAWGPVPCAHKHFHVYSF